MDASIPNKAYIQTLVNQGLAIRFDGGKDVSLSATHEDIVDLLSVALPGPMRFFEHLGLTVFTDPSTGLTILSAPPWCLLTRVRQRLEIVQVVNPTGRDLFTHRGPKNTTDRNIYLCEFSMQHP